MANAQSDTSHDRVSRLIVRYLPCRWVRTEELPARRRWAWLALPVTNVLINAASGSSAMLMTAELTIAKLNEKPSTTMRIKNDRAPQFSDDIRNTELCGGSIRIRRPAP